MKNTKFLIRRNFLKKATQTILGTAGLLSFPTGILKAKSALAISDDLNVIGPKAGFTPQVGTLVSMMNFMRDIILRDARGLSIKDLDFLIDEEANTIGAMLWHLAAIERTYQGMTFDGNQWNGLPKKEQQLWRVASNLGSEARQKIKGYNLDFYLNILGEVRAFSIAEMKKRDDEWLMAEDYSWGGRTNNYAKWFHVVEHESNHNGQIRYISKRVK